MHAPLTVDLLLADATVITADPERPVLCDGAVGIQNDRIVLVCTQDELPPQMEARRTLRLHDRVVVPGFVNVHTHAILSMVRGVAEDLGFAPAYTPGIPHGHDVSPEEACALARLGALEALRFGSTLINDTYVHADVTMEAMAETGVRVYSCGRLHDVDFSGVADGRWEYHRSIGERTLREALELARRFHGARGGRLGVQLAAHAPDTCSDAFLREIGEAARAHGLRVASHLAQSRTEVAQVRRRSGRTPVELYEDCGLLNDQLLAAHCLHLTPSDVERAGRAGIFVAHVPKGNATGGTMAPTPALRRAGARIALATDNMHADMVEVMRWALAVARVQLGAVADDWQPADALRMATREGAAAMGLADRLGSIEVGKQADLVVLDFRKLHLRPVTNALGNLVHVAQGGDVELVTVAGEIVVEHGTPTLVDEERVRHEADRAAAALWSRARAGTAHP
jgi:5-methylthioadenosine/S-adenosylhomocysteine deaminase